MENLVTSAPGRTVLEGVPRVHFYEGGKRCPEDIIFPSVLRAWLEYMGDEDFGCKHCIARTPECKVNCTYSFLMGMTGAASYLAWCPGLGPDIMPIDLMSDEADAPYRRALESIGYDYEWIDRQPGHDNEALFRRHVKASVDEGRPVIAFGVVGPVQEASLVAGYDHDGDTVLGWSFFQQFPDAMNGLEFEPGGYFRKRNWFNDTRRLVVLGEKRRQPDMGKLCREALQWMVKVARTPVANGKRVTGLAAYQAWADDILRDDQFPPQDEASLRTHHGVHNDAVGTLAEVRWYGSQFLLQAVDHLHYRLAEDLMHAAACFAGEHELMWQVWDLAGGNGNPNAYRKMAEPDVRRQMARVILQSHGKFSRAMDYIEHALAL